ncbi:MAG: tetratricopeptide repeat protein [Alphaproteobacteria bacterium]|nr:tetratricopeptide repeat protein [Alphaproteobacteria bacterium]
MISMNWAFLLLALTCGPKRPPAPLPDPAAEAARLRALRAEQRSRDIAALEQRLNDDQGSPERQLDDRLRLATLQLEAAVEAEDPAPLAEEARKNLVRLLRDGPEYAHADAATYQLTVALTLLGAREEAVKVATRLVKTYPTSEHVQAAYVVLGDYYFDQNNAYKALLAYMKATNYTDGDQTQYARYKLAWCYYNVGEYGKAIESMERAVLESRARVAESLTPDSPEARLHDAGLRDLVRFYADAGQVDEGRRFLEELGEAEAAGELLERVAQLYLDQGRIEHAAPALRALRDEAPLAPEALQHQLELIGVYWVMRDSEALATEVVALRAHFGPGSAWAKRNPAQAQAADQAIEAALREKGQHFLLQAQRLPEGPPRTEALERAELLLGYWLDDYPGLPKRTEVLLDMGHVQRGLGREDLAEGYWREVLLDRPGSEEADEAAALLGVPTQ